MSFDKLLTTEVSGRPTQSGKGQAEVCVVVDESEQLSTP